MVALITALCIAVLGSGGMDPILTIHFNGHIAPNNADYVIITVWDKYDEVFGTTGNLYNATSYEIWKEYVSWHAPYKIRCSWVFDMMIRFEVVEDILVEDFVEIPQYSNHYYFTHDF